MAGRARPARPDGGGTGGVGGRPGAVVPAAGQPAWYAEVLSELRVGVTPGGELPQAFDLARARRLGAEIDLILAMGRAAFEPPAAPTALPRQPAGAKDATAGFTAFPELKAAL